MKNIQREVRWGEMLFNVLSRSFNLSKESGQSRERRGRKDEDKDGRKVQIERGRLRNLETEKTSRYGVLWILLSLLQVQQQVWLELMKESK